MLFLSCCLILFIRFCTHFKLLICYFSVFTHAHNDWTNGHRKNRKGYHHQYNILRNMNFDWKTEKNKGYGAFLVDVYKLKKYEETYLHVFLRATYKKTSHRSKREFFLVC